MVLKVHNAQGFLTPTYELQLSPIYGLRPSQLAQNIVSWMSNCNDAMERSSTYAFVGRIRTNLDAEAYCR